MKITFGLDLDGRVYPDVLHGRDAAIGEIFCGPLGFLTILETWLGLLVPSAIPSERVEHYRQRLHSLDNGKQFFSASLAADAIAVAETLLGWRDELVFYGWKPDASEPVPKRLRELALVELIAEDDAPALPLSFADRFRQVRSQLSGSMLPVEWLRLAEPLKALPAPWRAMIRQLEENGVQIIPQVNDEQTAEGDLGKLQRVFSEEMTSESKGALQGDGSLILLHSDSEGEAAEAMANWFAEGNNSERLMIVPGEDAILNIAFKDQGLPSLGMPHFSIHRPILQILPLVFALTWKPLNPFRLLEFLSLPHSPVPRELARELSDVVSRFPGIGSEVWNQTIDKWIEKQKASATKNWGTPLSRINPSKIKLEDHLKGLEKNLRAIVQNWLETERYLPAAGIPYEEALAITNRITAWCKGKPFAVPLARSVAQLSSLLKLSETETIPELQLNRMISLALDKGASLTNNHSEAGFSSWVTNPGAVVEEVDEIVWWGFTGDHTPTPKRYPWRAMEDSYLREQGICFPDLAEQTRNLQNRLKNPFLKAAKKMILVIPANVCGEPVIAHPLYDFIRATFTNLDKATVSLQSWLQKGNSALTSLRTAEVSPRKYPQARRWWKLPSGDSLTPRDCESYSSLESLFFHPYKWVLHYKARIRAGTLNSIPQGNLQLGNLAHGLLEQLLTEKTSLTSWNTKAIQQWMKANLEPFLSKQGATLLLPGQEPEKARFSQKIEEAACALMEHLKENGWELDTVEKEVEGTLSTQKISGYIDIALRRAANSSDTANIPGLIDVKWGGMKYRMEHLQENRALQLVLYAKMLSFPLWPHFAYFIIDGSTLLVQDQNGFKNARLAAPEESATPADLWQCMESTWKWRRNQLAQGWIEVPLMIDEKQYLDHGNQKPDNPDPPNNGLELPGKPPYANDFELLLGIVG